MEVFATNGTELFDRRYTIVAASVLTVSSLVYINRKSLLNFAYDFIAVSRPTKSGQLFLNDNFAPVSDEVFVEDLEVEGTIPASLNGAYMRNGPNPFYQPLHGYHWFDGDGMLHACRIKDGKASYANHFVKTNRLMSEQKAGKPLYLKAGDMFGERNVLLAVLDTIRRKLGAVESQGGLGTANTSLQFHAGRLLALNEGDMPYAVRVLCSGLVETLGRLQLKAEKGTAYAGGAFTAHPKLDSTTGQLFFLGYNFDSAPYLRVGVLDKEGVLEKQIDVDLPWSAMIHDMAITENFIVILHLPLCFDPQAMVKDKKLPIVFAQDRPARFGLLRKDAPDASGIQWFELPALMIFHVANAYEEGGKVKLYACHFDQIDLDLEVKKHDLARLCEYTFDLESGTASMRKVTEVFGDFPVVHPLMHGKKTRYSWVAAMDNSSVVPDFIGIAKMDLSQSDAGEVCVGRIMYEQGCHGGEAVFVPRDHDSSKCNGEDDGFLVVYVYDTNANKSYMHVYDAVTMDNKPLACVHLPQRVPYGFHGTFVPEFQLQTQKGHL